MKCGKRITGQTFYGSLCEICSDEYGTFEGKKLEKYFLTHPNVDEFRDSELADKWFLEFVEDKVRIIYT